MNLQELRECMINGLTEFSEHPIEYTSSAVKDVIKDYWDLGACVLAGFAFNDYGSETFGELRFPLMTAGGIASLYGANNSNDRLMRNFYGGLASWAHFYSRGLDIPSAAETGNQAAAAALASISLYFDRFREHSSQEHMPYVASAQHPSSL